MADEFDPFATSTGLPDSLDVTVEEAWFEFDPEYNNGQTLLAKMTVMTNDEEFGDAGRGTLMYPCGEGWSAAERGAAAVRDDGNMKKGFNNSCGYAKFFLGAIECEGAEKVLRSEGRGDPRKAGMWVGTSWHLDRKETDYGGDIGKRSRLIPTAFLGEGGSGGTKAAGATKATGPVKKAAGPVAKAGAPVQKATGPVKKAAPAAATEAVEELPADEGTVDIPGEFGPTHPLYDTLYQMALAAPDHDTFMEQAFSSVEGVNGDEVVEAAVMSNGPDSMWAAAVAEYEASQG